jgi:hypothetical protein
MVAVTYAGGVKVMKFPFSLDTLAHPHQASGPNSLEISAAGWSHSQVPRCIHRPLLGIRAGRLGGWVGSTIALASFGQPLILFCVLSPLDSFSNCHYLFSRPDSGFTADDDPPVDNNRQTADGAQWEVHEQRR